MITTKHRNENRQTIIRTLIYTDSPFWRGALCHRLFLRVESFFCLFGEDEEKDPGSEKERRASTALASSHRHLEFRGACSRHRACFFLFSKKTPKDSIEQIWRLPIEELPVHKDLFRLFSRTTVTETSAPAIPAADTANEEGEAAREPGVFDVWFKDGIELAEKYVASDWGQLQREGQITLGGEPLQATLTGPAGRIVMVTDASRVVNTEDSTRYYAVVPVSRAPAGYATSCQNCDDGTSLSTIFCSVCKEAYCGECDEVLHRRKEKREHQKLGITAIGIAFASRAESGMFREYILEGGLPKPAPSVSEPEKVVPNDAPDSDNVQKQFVHFVVDLVQRLDGPELAKKVDAWFRQQLHTSAKPEMELVVAELVGKVIPNSVTNHVLKAVNQRIALTASFHLKSTVLDGIFTCDVRERDGWTIAIAISPETVTVTHARRECAMPSMPPEKQFTFAYSVRIVFSRDARNLYASSLRITNVDFGPEAAPDFRALVNRRLGHGNLLIN